MWRSAAAHRPLRREPRDRQRACRVAFGGVHELLVPPRRVGLASSARISRRQGLGPPEHDTHNHSARPQRITRPQPSGRVADSVACYGHARSAQAGQRIRGTHPGPWGRHPLFADGLAVSASPSWTCSHCASRPLVYSEPVMSCEQPWVFALPCPCSPSTAPAAQKPATPPLLPALRAASVPVRTGHQDEGRNPTGHGATRLRSEHLTSTSARHDIIRDRTTTLAGGL